MNLGPARLYLDDIEAITASLETFVKERRAAEATEAKDTISKAKEPDSPDDVSIELFAADAKADSIEDLRDATPEELNHLTIFCEDPTISIDLWHIQAEVLTDRSNPEARALADDIAAFVKCRRSWSASWRTRTGYIVFTLGYFGLAAAASFIIGLHSYASHHSGFTYVIVGLVFVAIAVFTAGLALIGGKDVPGTVIIIPTRRSESRRLSQRARRDLIIATIAAVGGGIVIAIAGLWAGLFVK